MSDDRPIDVSVVIPCAGTEHLDDQLGALAAQETSRSFEVIVADNSRQGLVARHLDRRSADGLVLRVVDASELTGCGYARNVGARSAKGAAIVFVDADDRVAPGYVEAMADALERHRFVAARIDLEALNPPWAATTRPLAQTSGLGLSWLPYGYGATLGLQRPMFEELGGFDDRLRGAAEDSDLCYRAALNGVELAFVPDAVLHYRLRTSLKAIFRQAVRYGQGGAAMFARFRAAGMPRRSIASGLRLWVGAVATLLRARDRGALAAATYRIGVRAGHLIGSVQHRVWYL